MTARILAYKLLALHRDDLDREVVVLDPCGKLFEVVGMLEGDTVVQVAVGRQKNVGTWVPIDLRERILQDFTFVVEYGEALFDDDGREDVVRGILRGEEDDELVTAFLQTVPSLREVDSDENVRALAEIPRYAKAVEAMRRGDVYEIEESIGEEARG